MSPAKPASFLKKPAVLLTAMAVFTTALVAGAVGIATESWRSALIVALDGLAVILFAVLVFLLWRILSEDRERKLKAGTEDEGDALEQQRLERSEREKRSSLDESFARGLSALRSSKRTRDLPWYLVIGETGSGKSSAIAACESTAVPGHHQATRATRKRGLRRPVALREKASKLTVYGLLSDFVVLTIRASPC